MTRWSVGSIWGMCMPVGLRSSRFVSGHLCLTSFSKMRVDLAAQVTEPVERFVHITIIHTTILSESVASALRFRPRWCHWDNQICVKLWQIFWHVECLKLYCIPVNTSVRTFNYHIIHLPLTPCRLNVSLGNLFHAQWIYLVAWRIHFWSTLTNESVRWWSVPTSQMLRNLAFFCIII